MKNGHKNDTLEFRRKIFHILVGLFFVGLIYLDLIGVLGILIIFLLGLFLSLIVKRRNVPVISYMLNLFEREKDKKTVPGKGALFIMLGFTLSLVLFPKDVAMAAIIILTVGDGLSHLVGRFSGAMPHPLNANKMIEGTIVGTFFAFLSAMIFVNPIEAFFAAGIAMGFEAVEWKIWGQETIDDNLIVPVIAGIVIILMRIL
ncbi:MAG: diacylglycerol/polyprenol kinase family protein [Candidatus Nanoarchaeia archaeon]